MRKIKGAINRYKNYAIVVGIALAIIATVDIATRKDEAEASELPTQKSESAFTDLLQQTEYRLLKEYQSKQAKPTISVWIYGKKANEDIVEYFREELAKYGIEWWLKYAIAQGFQESGLNPIAENKNGLDKGLLQYRIPFWESVCAEYGESGEWQDWKLQIRIYCQRVAKGLKDGKSIETVISDHNTGGYGFNEKYVRDVLRHLPNIKEERR